MDIQNSNHIDESGLCNISLKRGWYIKRRLIRLGMVTPLSILNDYVP